MWLQFIYESTIFKNMIYNTHKTEDNKQEMEQLIKDLLQAINELGDLPPHATLMSVTAKFYKIKKKIVEIDPNRKNS
jgi:hypothetical protein